MKGRAELELFVIICAIIAVVTLMCFIPPSDASPVVTGSNENDYLNFTFPEGGGYVMLSTTDQFYDRMVYYSYNPDDERDWHPINHAWEECEVEGGQTIYFRGCCKEHFSLSSDAYYYFVLNVNNEGEKVSANGNVMSLICGDEYNSEEAKTIPNDYCFCGLFWNCVNLDKAPSLPAIHLKKHCYDSMFEGCTSLTTIPELPAGKLGEDGNVIGELADGCYKDMFKSTMLTNIPENYLPATILAKHCYENMFEQCTLLTELPKLLLQSTDIKESCYQEMFRGCKSLTSIPDGFLPATTLQKACYRGMFKDCASLTDLPECLLPAGHMEELGKYVGKIAKQCYDSMFENCISLKSAPNLFLRARVMAEDCYYEMFRGCKSLLHTPDLPAGMKDGDEITGKLAEGCYQGMFRDCTSLKDAPFLLARVTEDDCYDDLFRGCSRLNRVIIYATDIGAFDDDSLDRWLQGTCKHGTLYTWEYTTWSDDDRHGWDIKNWPWPN